MCQYNQYSWYAILVMQFGTVGIDVTVVQVIVRLVGHNDMPGFVGESDWWVRWYVKYFSEVNICQG